MSDCLVCGFDHHRHTSDLARILAAHGIVEHLNQPAPTGPRAGPTPPKRCPCGDALHDVPIGKVSVSKFGGDDRIVSYAEGPWYTIDQVHALFRINQPSMRSRLQDGMWRNWGHKAASGHWVIATEDLLKMLLEDNNTTT